MLTTNRMNFADFIAPIDDSAFRSRYYGECPLRLRRENLAAGTTMR